MHPVLTEFDCFGRSVTINAYTAGMIGMALIFTLGGWTIARRRGLPSTRVLICQVVVLAASLIGARLLHWSMHADFYRDTPELIWSVAPGRFAFQGAVLAALVTGLFGCLILRIDPYQFGDAIAPAIALGIVSIRVGCFLNGCCFGEETNLPWGVLFPTGSPAHLHLASGSIGLCFESPRPVHPTQLYEVLASLLAAGLAIGVGRTRCPSGTAFLVSAIWLASFQWVNSFFRAQLNPSSPLETAYPLFHVGFILAGATVLLWRCCRAPSGCGARCATRHGTMSTTAWTHPTML